MRVLFHDAFLDHVLEIFLSEKCAVLLNCMGTKQFCHFREVLLIFLATCEL